jgi:glycosyltransferase involved in cell wall biosynthesis
MNIIHATTAHMRYDTRIFHRECVNLAYEFSVSLYVADGRDDENTRMVRIRSVTRSENRAVKVFCMTKALFSASRSKSIIHLHDPELFPTALLLKVFGFKVVVDIHEDFAKQIYLKHYLPKFFRPILSVTYRFIEKCVLHSVDFSVVCCSGFLDRKKSILVGNFITMKEARSLKMANEPLTRKRRSFIYSGGLSNERGLFNLLMLAEKLKERGINLIIAGNFDNEVSQAQAEQYDGWSNVEYLGYVEREKLLGIQKSCLAGVILFNNVGQYYLASSVKLSEYLACGLPVLMPEFGEWIELNKQFGLGRNTKVENVDIETIDQLISYGDTFVFQKSAEKFLREFSLDECIGELSAKYRGLL